MRCAAKGVRLIQHLHFAQGIELLVGIASEALDQKFDGVVVPCQWVQVVPHQDGVVSRIPFEPGNTFRKRKSRSPRARQGRMTISVNI